MYEMVYVWIVLVFGIMPDCRSHMKFSRVESCYDPTQTPETYHTITGISVLLCGVLCARDKRCKSISITGDGNNVTCYHNTERRLLSTGCENQSRHLNGYHSSCHYHGVFLNDSYGCRCYGGYIGAWCERLMQDCSEGSSTDHYRDVPGSVFYIQPNNSPRAFKVVCRMALKATYLFKRRFDSAYVNFSRPWQEYKNGFGNVIFAESFWSGLEMIHHVTNNRPHTMRIFVMFQEDGTMLWRKHSYFDFQVGSEKYGYNFTFSSAKSHDVDSAANEGLSAFLGARFSTYDVDNDNDNNTNCANVHQSGWWFTTCDGYNPTGQPQPPSVQYKTSDPTQLSWPHSLNYSPVKINMFVVAENN